jgi:hypothetical protein
MKIDFIKRHGDTLHQEWDLSHRARKGPRQSHESVLLSKLVPNPIAP